MGRTRRKEEKVIGLERSCRRAEGKRQRGGFSNKIEYIFEKDLKEIGIPMLRIESGVLFVCIL